VIAFLVLLLWYNKQKNKGGRTMADTKPAKVQIEQMHIDDVEIDEIFKKITKKPYDEAKVKAQFEAIENAYDTPRN